MKFFVRSWQEVRLKYRVIERFRGKYSVEAMLEYLRYPAAVTTHSETGKAEWQKISG